jgi:hypothetical protein
MPSNGGIEQEILRTEEGSQSQLPSRLFFFGGRGGGVGCCERSSDGRTVRGRVICGTVPRGERDLARLRLLMIVESAKRECGD